MAWCVREINIFAARFKKRKATNRDNASWHGSASPGDAEAPGLVVDEHHQPEGKRQPGGKPAEVAAGAANDTVSLAEETTQKEVRGNYHGLYKVAYSFLWGASCVRASAVEVGGTAPPTWSRLRCTVNSKQRRKAECVVEYTINDRS